MFRYLYKKLIRPFLIIRSSPHSIALGASLGVFIGLTPTVGFQMLLVIFIGTAIGANRIIALILCWISNPLTFLPMYYGYYYLGAKILGRDLWIFSSFSRKMDEFLEAKQDLGYMGTIKMFGSDIIWPLWVGSVILALAAAIPCYLTVLYAVRRQRRKREERRRARRAALEAQKAEAAEEAKAAAQAKATAQTQSSERTDVAGKTEVAAKTETPENSKIADRAADRDGDRPGNGGLSAQAMLLLIFAGAALVSCSKGAGFIRAGENIAGLAASNWHERSCVCLQRDPHSMAPDTRTASLESLITLSGREGATTVPPRLREPGAEDHEG